MLKINIRIKNKKNKKKILSIKYKALYFYQNSKKLVKLKFCLHYSRISKDSRKLIVKSWLKFKI